MVEQIPIVDSVVPTVDPCTRPHAYAGPLTHCLPHTYLTSYTLAKAFWRRSIEPVPLVKLSTEIKIHLFEFERQQKLWGGLWKPTGMGTTWLFRAQLSFLEQLSAKQYTNHNRYYFLHGIARPSTVVSSRSSRMEDSIKLFSLRHVRTYVYVCMY